jgi:hypothetical protein
MNDVKRGNRSPFYQKLGHLLDSSVRLPGGFRIGLDGILGLIPGIGDMAGAVLSTLILYEAYRRGAPKAVLIKMLMNIGVDTTVGAIPLVGDAFDFFWKANKKNVRLLDEYQSHPKTARRKSIWGAVMIMVAAIIVLWALFYLAWSLIQWLWQLIF